MVSEEIKSKRDAGKWAEKWRAEMNAVADNMPSMEANKTISEVFMEFLNHQLNTGEIEKSTYNNSYYYLADIFFFSRTDVAFSILSNSSASLFSSDIS